MLEQCNREMKLITQSIQNQLQRQPPEVFYEKSGFTNFTKFKVKDQCQSLFFNKVAETLAVVLSCEFCGTSKNTFFTEHLWTTASIITWIFTDIHIVKVNTKFVAQRRIQKHVKYLR